MRSIAIPIQGVLNGNHCAETSDKVREAFDMKRRNGEHIGSFAAYGYIKDTNDKNALVIDEQAVFRRAEIRILAQIFVSFFWRKKSLDKSIICIIMKGTNVFPCGAHPQNRRRTPLVRREPRGSYGQADNPGRCRQI